MKRPMPAPSEGIRARDWKNFPIGHLKDYLYQKFPKDPLLDHLEFQSSESVLQFCVEHLTSADFLKLTKQRRRKSEALNNNAPGTTAGQPTTTTTTTTTVSGEKDYRSFNGRASVPPSSFLAYRTSIGSENVPPSGHSSAAHTPLLANGFRLGSRNSTSKSSISQTPYVPAINLPAPDAAANRRSWLNNTSSSSLNSRASMPPDMQSPTPTQTNDRYSHPAFHRGDELFAASTTNQNSSYRPVIDDQETERQLEQVIERTSAVRGGSRPSTQRTDSVPRGHITDTGPGFKNTVTDWSRSLPAERDPSPLLSSHRDRSSYVRADVGRLAPPSIPPSDRDRHESDRSSRIPSDKDQSIEKGPALHSEGAPARNSAFPLHGTASRGNSVQARRIEPRMSAFPKATEVTAPPTRFANSAARGNQSISKQQQKGGSTGALVHRRSLPSGKVAGISGGANVRRQTLPPQTTKTTTHVETKEQEKSVPASPSRKGKLVLIVAIVLGGAFLLLGLPVEQIYRRPPPTFCDNTSWSSTTTSCHVCPFGARCQGGQAECQISHGLERSATGTWTCTDQRKKLSRLAEQGFKRIVGFLRKVEMPMRCKGDESEHAASEKSHRDVLQLFEDFVAPLTPWSVYHPGPDPQLREGLLQIFLEEWMTPEQLRLAQLEKRGEVQVTLGSRASLNRWSCRIERQMPRVILFTALTGTLGLLIFISSLRAETGRSTVATKASSEARRVAA